MFLLYICFHDRLFGFQGEASIFQSLLTLFSRTYNILEKVRLEGFLNYKKVFLIDIVIWLTLFGQDNNNEVDFVPDGVELAIDPDSEF